MSVPVRPLLPIPQKGGLPFYDKSFNSVIKDGINFLPSLEDFGFSKEEIALKVDSRQCYPFKGGEEYGLKRM